MANTDRFNLLMNNVGVEVSVSLNVNVSKAINIRKHVNELSVSIRVNGLRHAHVLVLNKALGSLVPLVDNALDVEIVWEVNLGPVLYSVHFV